MSGFEPAGGGGGEQREQVEGPDAVAPVRFVPMKVGDAEVYVEVSGAPAEVAAPEGFQPVGGLDPKEAFDRASDALKECVAAVGARLAEVGGALEPDEVGVEFTITFEAEGKANIIPVLLTGKAKSSMGVTVNAVWRPRERRAGGGGT